MDIQTLKFNIWEYSSYYALTMQNVCFLLHWGLTNHTGILWNIQQTKMVSNRQAEDCILTSVYLSFGLKKKEVGENNYAQ